MKITQVLLGEHGAMYPLIEFIEKGAGTADLAGLKLLANVLGSTLLSHADLEDALLRPEISHLLPSSHGPSDHEVIRGGLGKVMAAIDENDARTTLVETLALTRKHFLKEESSIFAIACRELPIARQEEIGAEWARRRGVSVQ
jgi:hypothetical protein